MAKVVPITPARRKRTIKSAEGPNSHPVSVRVPAALFRRMTEIVESPEYPETRTKSDLMLEAIEALLESYQEQSPDDPRWSSYNIFQELQARERREEEYAAADKLLNRCKQENDRQGLLRLLVSVRHLEQWFVGDNASEWEIGRVRVLIATIHSCLGVSL